MGAAANGPAAAAPEPDLATKVRFLSDGAHLGDPAASVERIETHFAWVFLTPHRAYKLRKPIRYHGLDARSVAARRASCEQELFLNRELAPGVYLEAVPLVALPGGCLKLGGEGDVVDWLIRMRRLPAERMLERVALAGRLCVDDLVRLFEHLTGFYARSPAFAMSGKEYCSHIDAQVEENCSAVSATAVPNLALSRVFDLAWRQRQLLERLSAALARRAEQGHIRECHGDLRPEHIWLGPPVLIIDRLEFDASLRRLDPLEELCFLRLECERLGFPAAGRWLVDRYVAAETPDEAQALAGLYLSNRAFGRARLAAWRLSEPGADRVHWAARVHDYVHRSLEAVQRAQSE